MKIHMFTLYGLLFVALVAEIELRSELKSVKAQLIAYKSDADSSAAAAVKQFEKDVFARINGEEAALKQRAAQEASAASNDLRALPTDNFRSGPKPWKDN